MRVDDVASETCQALGDGTYLIEFTVPTGSNTIQYNISVWVSGDQIGTAYPNTAKKSPYTIATSPPDADAANSFCFGELLSKDSRAGAYTRPLLSST